MRHLLGIEGLSRTDIEAILDRAERHLPGSPGAETSTPLRGKLVANMFFEDSTRTRSSFEAAAKALGAEVLNWTAKGSSVSKGESLVDTVRNIEAMGPAAIVMRHASSGAAHLAAQHLGVGGQ